MFKGGKKTVEGFSALAWRNNTEGKVLCVIATRNVKDRLGEDTEMASGLKAGRVWAPVTASGLGALPSLSGLILGMEDV